MIDARKIIEDAYQRFSQSQQTTKPVDKFSPWALNLADAAYEAGRRDVKERSLDINLQRRVTELEAWKSSAMSVMEPLQRLAKEFNIPLGAPITEGIADLVRRQKASIDALQYQFNRAIERRDELLSDLEESQAHVADLELEAMLLRSEIGRLRGADPAPQSIAKSSPNFAARWGGGAETGMLRDE